MSGVKRVMLLVIQHKGSCDNLNTVMSESNCDCHDRIFSDEIGCRRVGYSDHYIYEEALERYTETYGHDEDLFEVLL